MKKISFLLLIIGFMMTGLIKAQTYSIVIKGGHVIDPKNKIDDVMDIAVKDGRISLIAKNIDTKGAVQVVNADGLYVTPGLIDMHVHVYQGTNPDQAYMNGPSSVTPDVQDGEHSLHSKGKQLTNLRPGCWHF